MQLDEGLAERQAQSHPVVETLQPAVGLPERQRRHGGVETDAVVPDGKGQPAGLLDAGRDADPAADRGELDGVGQQVKQGLTDEPCVADEQRQGVLDVEVDRPLRCRLAGQGEAVPHEGREGDPLAFRVQRAAFDLRQTEDVLDLAVQFGAAVEDVAGVLPVARLAELALPHEVGEADHVVERRPQLVPDRREDGLGRAFGDARLGAGMAQLPLQLLGLGDDPVQPGGELPLPPVQRDALADGAGQLVARTGFAVEALGAAPVDRVDRGLPVAAAGEHHAHGVGRGSLDPRQQLGAVHSRHAHVRDDDRDGPQPFELGQGLLSARGGQEIEAPAQLATVGCQHVRFVVDQQYLRGHATCSYLAVSSRPVAEGVRPRPSVCHPPVCRPSVFQAADRRPTAVRRRSAP